MSSPLFIISEQDEFVPRELLPYSLRELVVGPNVGDDPVILIRGPGFHKILSFGYFESQERSSMSYADLLRFLGHLKKFPLDLAHAYRVPLFTVHVRSDYLKFDFNVKPARIIVSKKSFWLAISHMYPEIPPEDIPL